MQNIEGANKDLALEEVNAIKALLEGQASGKHVDTYKSQFDAVAGHVTSLVLTLVNMDDESGDNDWIDWIEHYINS